MFVLNPRSKAPIFEQLKQQILEFILVKVLNPNDKLPSVRSLASELGINPNTVAKAYQELELQGYVYTVPGKGCFISDNNLEEQIKEQKLVTFASHVEDMKHNHISEEILIQTIKNVYKGGNEDA